MRILTVGNMYPPHYLGGAELVWQSAVRGLRAAGHDVRVLATDVVLAGSGAEQDADVHRDLRWYWRDHDFPRLGFRERRRLERHNLATFDRHVEEFRPDALSWWSLGGISLSIVRRTQLPSVGFVNDDWLVYAPLVDQWGRLLRRNPRLATASRWIFCSPALERSMQRALPAMDDSGAEMPGAPAIFSERPAHDWSWRLLYVGRIDERKGIITAVEALAGLPRATLTIAGNGDEAELARLHRRIAELGVGDRVTFDHVSRRPQLPDVYAAADVLLFPVQWFEPFGIVPVEAMGVGTPVVATGKGGSGDYMRDGENVLLFPAGDAAALAAAVRRLESDPALRARLRAGGLATAAELTEERWTAAVVREHERLSP